MCGYSAAEIYDNSRPLWSAVHSDDLDSVDQAFGALFGEGRAIDVEFRVRHADGRWIWLHSSSGQVYEKNGLRCACGTLVDVTERRQAEIALQQSEAGYRSLFESAGDAIFLMSEDVFIDCNSATLDMFGGTREQIVGHHPVDFSPPRQKDGRDSTEAAAVYIGQAYEGGAPVFNWLHRRLDGTVFDAEVRLTRLFIREKPCLLAIVRDTTSRTQVLEALRRSEAKYREIVESSPIGFIRSDADGRVLDANSSIAHMIGFDTPEKLIEETNAAGGITVLYADALERPGFLARLRQKSGWHNDRREFRHCTGKVITLKLRSHLLAQIDGSDVIESFAEDITEQLETERKRRQLEDRLRQSQKMEAVGTLAGGIAHDFNNILSAVLGNAELAKVSASMGEDVTEELDEVLKAGLRARDLVKHILTFSRKTEVRKEPVDLCPLIEETLGFVRASAPSTIAVRCDLAATDGRVVADATQIHQVLMNLCTNAIHAMKEAGGVLSVDLEQVDLRSEASLEFRQLPAGRYFRITVGDTGHGMPQRIVDRIFDPFYTTKERGEGTGLGLSVVHGILEEMGGTISVYSEVGQGTNFILLLPIQKGGITETAKSVEIPRRGHGRILLVDDEESIVSFGSRMLTGLGYEMTATTSSLEALDLFREAPEDFDLVLTDMTMPQLTGLDLARRILEIRPEVPVVLTTGFSATLTTESIGKIGIRKILMKPLIMSELAETITGLLANEGSRIG